MLNRQAKNVFFDFQFLHFPAVDPFVISALTLLLSRQKKTAFPPFLKDRTDSIRAMSHPQVDPAPTPIGVQSL
jgi:hypothetical protein